MWKLSMYRNIQSTLFKIIKFRKQIILKLIKHHKIIKLVLHGLKEICSAKIKKIEYRNLYIMYVIHQINVIYNI